MGTVLTSLRKKKYIDGGAVRELPPTAGEPIPPPQGPYVRDSWGALVRLDKDYDTHLVKKLIRARRLAPFYPGSSDSSDNSSTANLAGSADSGTSETVAASTKKPKRKSDPEEECFDEKWLKEGLVECPICLLGYPRNVNYTACCRQPLCTACFVKLKRPNSGRVISCPFCVYANFSVQYHKPRWIQEISRPEPERNLAVKPEPVAAEAVKILSANEQRMAYQAFQQRLYQQHHQQQQQQQQNRRQTQNPGSRYVFYEPSGPYTFYDQMYYRNPTFYTPQYHAEQQQRAINYERTQLEEAIRRSLLESATP